MGWEEGSRGAILAGESSEGLCAGTAPFLAPVARHHRHVDWQDSPFRASKVHTSQPSSSQIGCHVNLRSPLGLSENVSRTPPPQPSLSPLRDVRRFYRGQAPFHQGIFSRDQEQ